MSDFDQIEGTELDISQMDAAELNDEQLVGVASPVHDPHPLRTHECDGMHLAVRPHERAHRVLVAVLLPEDRQRHTPWTYCVQHAPVKRT